MRGLMDGLGALRRITWAEVGGGFSAGRTVGTVLPAYALTQFQVLVGSPVRSNLLPSACLGVNSTEPLYSEFFV